MPVTIPNAMNKAGRNPCNHGVYLFTAQNQWTPLPSEVRLVILRRSLLLKKESWLDTRNSSHPCSGFTSTSIEWAVTETTEASRASEMRQGTQGTNSAEAGPMNKFYILCVLGAGEFVGQREQGNYFSETKQKYLQDWIRYTLQKTVMCKKEKNKA